MKHISLLFLLVGLSISAMAQEIVIDTSYYAPPPVVRKRVLTDDPDQNPNHHRLSTRREKSTYEQAYQLKETQTWYVGLDGGFRTDGGMLSNSFDGLISINSSTKASWSVLLGYTYRNAWTVETGYTSAPIHLNITIANGARPLTYNYQNSGYGIPLRIKRRIGLASRAANGTGFWLTAGAWLIPNGSVNLDDFRLIGYSYRNNRTRTDTLRLDNTTTTKSISGVAELGIDYSVRLSSSIEFGAYLRKYWGLGEAIRSDIVYTVNGIAQPQSTAKANGTGWGFGIALRYIYGRQQEVKNHNQ